MPDARRVALLGATGTTGRLVAAELAARGVPTVLAGREAGRLSQLRAGLPVRSPVRTAVVDAADPAAVGALCADADVLVSCLDDAEVAVLDVVDAAVAAGTPYVDATGDPEVLAELYRRHADAPVAVVPACGVDHLPGDLAAAVAVADLGVPAEEVLVGYDVRGLSTSRDAAQSALEALSGGEPPRPVDLPFPDGPRSAVTVAWAEQVTVPRHAGQARVTTALAVPRSVAAAAGPAGAALAPLLRRSRPLLTRLVARIPQSDAEAGETRARVLVVASGGGRSATVLVELRDLGRTTAATLTEAALRATGTGALAPAQALDAEAVLDALAAGEDLRWQRLPGAAAG